MKFIKWIAIGLLGSLVVSLDGVVYQAYPNLHAFIFMNLSFGFILGLEVQKWIMRRHDIK